MDVNYSCLRMYRVKAGFTQEEIAEKVGVSRQAVAKWERGETMPDISSCIKLADLFGVTVDMLVRRIDTSAHDEGDGKHVFGVSKLNDKGQITLPAECRRVFGLNPGDAILVLGDENKGIALVSLGSINSENE